MHVCNLARIELVTHLEYFCDSVLELEGEVNNNHATFRLVNVAVLLAGIYKSPCCMNYGAF